MDWVRSREVSTDSGTAPAERQRTSKTGAPPEASPVDGTPRLTHVKSGVRKTICARGGNQDKSTSIGNKAVICHARKPLDVHA